MILQLLFSIFISIAFGKQIKKSVFNICWIWFGIFWRFILTAEQPRYVVVAQTPGQKPREEPRRYAEPPVEYEDPSAYGPDAYPSPAYESPQYAYSQPRYAEPDRRTQPVRRTEPARPTQPAAREEPARRTQPARYGQPAAKHGKKAATAALLASYGPPVSYSVNKIPASPSAPLDIQKGYETSLGNCVYVVPQSNGWKAYGWQNNFATIFVISFCPILYEMFYFAIYTDVRTLRTAKSVN